MRSRYDSVMAEMHTLSLKLPDLTATNRLGGAMARCLQAGDCVLLEGALGAGKSALARAVIKARLSQVNAVEDVPSPSFTLVQTYLADIEIWHCDLYRLTSMDELDELDLEEALDSALVLIEWPERLGNLTPSRHLRIALTELSDLDEAREARFSPAGCGWAAVLEAARRSVEVCP